MRALPVFILTLFLLSVFSAGMCLAQLPDLRADVGKLKRALQMEKQAIASKDSLLLGKAYYWFGEAYNVGGRNAVAKNYYIKAERTLQPLGDSYELGMTSLRLIEELHLTFSSRQDIEYARKAIGIFSRIHSFGGMARGYNYLTSAYKRKWVWSGSDIARFRANRAQFDSLVQCIDTIAYYGRLAHDTVMIGESYLQFGDLFRLLKQRRAIIYMHTAQYLFARQKNDTATVHALCHLASTHMDFGQYKSAYGALEQARKLGKPVNDYFMITHLYEVLRDYYQQTGQWEKAFNYMTMLSTLYSHRLAGDRDQLIVALNLEHEAEKKDKQLQVQTNELEILRTQQKFMSVIVMLLLLTAGLSFFFFRLYRKNQRISHQNEELLKEQNHRVKNNLQVVSSLLSLQSKELTDKAALKAIEESRLRIQSMVIMHQQLYDGEYLATVDLVDFIPELVGGVLAAYGYAAIRPQFAVEPVWLPADKAVPLGIILNELTTNACKYAFPGNDSPEFEITCHQRNQRIELTVKDNGKGMNEANLERKPVEKESFGMRLIRAQVSQLRGVYQFRLGVIDEFRGVLFTLSFRG